MNHDLFLLDSDVAGGAHRGQKRIVGEQRIGILEKVSTHHHPTCFASYRIDQSRCGNI